MQGRGNGDSDGDGDSVERVTQHNATRHDLRLTFCYYLNLKLEPWRHKK